MRLLNLLLLALVGLCPDFLAAQTPTPSLDSTQALSLKEITDFSQLTTRLIQDTEALLKAQAKAETLIKDLAATDELISQKLMLLGDTGRLFRIDRLRSEEAELNLTLGRVSRWNELGNAWLENALDKDTLIEQYIRVWEFTLDSLVETQRPILDSAGIGADSVLVQNQATPIEQDSLVEADSLLKPEADYESITLIIERIRDHLKDLSQLKRELSPTLARCQVQQANLALIMSKFGEAQSLIDFKREKVLGEILIPEYPPIWEMTWDSDVVGLEEQFYQYMLGNYLVLKSFLEERPRFLHFSIFLFIVILGLVLQLRYRAQSLATAYEEEIKEARIALKHPVITSLLVAFFILDLFFGLSSEIYKLFSLVMLLPISYMLWRIKPEWGYGRIVFFILTYLIFICIPALNNHVALQRLILLSVGVVCLLLLLWLRGQKEKVAQENTWFLGSLLFFIPVFIFIWAIAILANVMGSVQFSQFLTIALLGTNLIFNVLRLVIELIRSLVFLVLLGPLHKHSYIIQEDAATVLRVSTYVLKWLGLVVWLIFTLDLLNFRDKFFRALHDFVTYPIVVGDVSFSLANILSFFVILRVSLWLSSIIRYILDKEVFPRAKLKPGIPDTISLTVRYTCVFLGFTLALAGAGIHFSQLSIALGGLGVGIGLGLQNLVSNFISGIILVLERPVKIGDFVELHDISGIVQDIGLRASTIRTWDGSDVVVPNHEFTSQRLTNWTFKDKRRRLPIEVKVPFDADMEKLQKLLIQTATDIPQVLSKPRPGLHFAGLGESAMEVTLLCWIKEAADFVPLGTQIRTRVYQALKEAGYDMPVPKRDVQFLPRGESLGKDQ